MKMLSNTLIPLRFSYDCTDNRGKIDSLIKGIKSFIIPLVNEYYPEILVDDTQMILNDLEDSFIMEFTPLWKGEMIMINSNRYTYVDLSTYSGYTFITPDSLCPYAVGTLGNRFPSQGVIKINNFYCLHNIHAREWLDIIQGLISRLHQKGFMSLETSNQYLADSYLELAYFWNSEIKRAESPIVIKCNVDFSITPQSWFLINAKRVLAGSLPKYRFTLEGNNILESNLHTGIPETREVLNSDGISGDFGDSVVNKIKLKFICISNYINLSEKYPELFEYIESIRIYDDMSVEGNFYSYQQVKEYQSLFSEPFQYSIIDIKQISNLEEGILLRYQLYLQSYKSLIIEYQNVYYVVSEGEIPESSEITHDKVIKDLNLPSDDLISSLGRDIVFGYTEFNSIIGSHLSFNSSKILQVEFKVENVNLVKETVKSSNAEVISIIAEISNDKFLLDNHNVNYMSDEEIISYKSELFLSSGIEILKAEDKKELLYEGGFIPKDDLVIMWERGDFMSKWSKFVYKSTKKFSRTPMVYHTDGVLF